MRNENIYKKLKYAIALNVIWNVSKHHDTRRNTMLWAFKQFNIPPLSRYITSVEDYSYYICNKIAMERNILWVTRSNIVGYAKEHGVVIYDMIDGEIVYA